VRVRTHAVRAHDILFPGAAQVTGGAVDTQGMNSLAHVLCLSSISLLAACGGGGSAGPESESSSGSAFALSSDPQGGAQPIGTAAVAGTVDLADAAEDAGSPVDAPTASTSLTTTTTSLDSGVRASARVAASGSGSRFADRIRDIFNPPGGGGTGGDPGDGSGSPPDADPDADDAQRIQAATDTANSSSNACAIIGSFYWEIGDAQGARAQGSVTRPGTSAVTDRTPMSWASASKWVYGAYVVQRLGGALDEQDVAMLSMRSGYKNMSGCNSGQTVDQCLHMDGNDRYSSESDGAFYYNGGHMQMHASSRMGLGSFGPTAFAAEIQSQLGADLVLGYSSSQPAGGAYGPPSTYTSFLRKVLNRQLTISEHLAESPACANPRGCPAGEAQYSPAPGGETWHYSLGHWIEDDPVVGDGAVSSPGAFGFYPWIDASRTTYGVLARLAPNGAHDSIRCGRIIRAAWMSGIAQ
jgi:hypothetical protein